VFLIKAIPIARGVGVEELSYWSPAAAATGAVIRAPLRKRTVGAIVASCESAAAAKSEIKSANFEVKKIADPEARAFLSPEFFAAAQTTAHYYAGTVGSALFELVPAPILASFDALPEPKPRIVRKKPRESYALQKPDDDRSGHYKSLVRERFARKESVFMVLPTVEDIKKATETFEKGISQYTYILHGGLSKTEIIKRWKAALDDPHPIVIVATGAFLSLPRHDIGLILVERENSRGYKLSARPFLDIRFFAEKFAREIGADLIFGDLNLSVETLWRHDEGTLTEYAPLSMRSLSTAKDELIDMKTYKRPGGSLHGLGIRLLSDELLSMIQKTHEESGLLFVFAGRKGLAPQTICSDCETVVTCDHCSAPLVLYGKDERRFFLCNRCGKREDAHMTCRTCNSWRLVTLGIGTERIEEEIRDTMRGTTVLRLDKTSAPTHKRALEITEEWYSSPGSVLVGTELALLYMDKPVERTAVASLDSLFAIPDFKINEKVFSIIARLRAAAQKQFLLQTRHPEASVLTHAVKGNIIDFYREEIEARKTFDFPPFSTFIKISYAGSRDDTLAAMEQLKVALEGFTVDVFPAFVATVRGDFVMHALVKVPRKDWPHLELISRLRQLPPSYAVNVDPESIL
jgi:Primosomal protein N'' (replication factor Y) - superfamily II helicase